VRTATCVIISLVLVSDVVGAEQTGKPRPARPTEIVCEGVYRSHLQGIASDRMSAIYWSFTRNLVKTDLTGKVLKSVAVDYHHGDLTYVDGRLYVAWSNYFNRPGAKSRVFVYDARDMTQLAVKDVPEVTYGAGAIEHHNGHFFVVGGLPDDVEENYVYEYDADFMFVKRHVIASGYTRLGIQAVGRWNGCWWFGCYGKALLKTDDAFALLGRYRSSFPYGIAAWDENRCLVGVHFAKSKRACRGRARWARMDPSRGLVVGTGGPR